MNIKQSNRCTVNSDSARDIKELLSTKIIEDITVDELKVKKKRFTHQVIDCKRRMMN